MWKSIVLFFAVVSVGESSGNATTKIEDTKIVGGREVEIIDAPFIVMLLVDNRPLCGASIISHNFFLTAAHCTQDMKAKQLTIRSGSSQFGEGEKHFVSKIFIHPKYDNSNFDNDFSIVKIYGRMFYNKNQRTIKLADEGDELVPGEMTRVLGWGNTQNSAESTEYLRGVELSLISDEDCEEAYKLYAIKINPNKVCAIHPDKIDGRDACQGDSGGPLQRLSDGKLIGVVSFGVGCAQAEYAGIYAKVSSARDWIKEIANV